MRWFSQNARTPSQDEWRLDLSVDGLSYTRSAAGGIRGSLIEPALVQWSDLGLAIERDGQWHVSWRDLYELLSDTDVDGHRQEFGIPLTIELAPRLVSRAALVDRDFQISIDGWIDSSGRAVDGIELRGAIASVHHSPYLLPRATWALIQRVAEFFTRSEDHRTERANRLGWAEIRRLAVASRAGLDDFLSRTVVLSPERLQIGLRRNREARVVEIFPGFDQCPDRWIETFDAHSSVRDRYDIPTPNGVVQVIVAPPVRAVLEQIKRLPGRRVSGARAEAFMTNPFAALGGIATEVIDPQEFENERARAGLIFDRFTSYVERDEARRVVDFGISVESGSGAGSTSTRVSFTESEAREFVAAIRKHLNAGHQLAAWHQYEFELLGNVDDELKVLEQASITTPDAAIKGDVIYDLSLYAERIEGFGEEQPYFSAYIARKDDGEGWFPKNLVNILEIPPSREGEEPHYLPLNAAQMKTLQERVDSARDRGETEVLLPATNHTAPLRAIEDVLAIFARAASDAATGRLETKIRERANRKTIRKGLVIKPNISVVDYLEERREVLLGGPQACKYPSALKRDTQLKRHQIQGLAWLQHLFAHSPTECRGAVLADDMGLGKTLQLLSLIAWAHERDGSLAPSLIVAPVALLENWREEILKFLQKDALRVLEVYGESLARLRVPKHEVDEQLRDDGLIRFLRPGWVGDSQVILTTYETLRDLEFSFAAEKWSIVICDEAQKVKNPNALITRAAKKQNARFRIACTGTPVENTLTDLWCLFDFVQPGLLGALNDFGACYRRPIEAKTEEEKARIEQLRRLIKPQILRRLKSDVAEDLPRKLEVVSCKNLPLSTVQRNLYARAVDQFVNRNDPAATSPFKSALHLLHHLKVVCTDPRPQGFAGSAPDTLDRYRLDAPKMNWVLETLSEIRNKNEKALVFCELKHLQRLLRHYIREELGYDADIINGDTSASSSSDQSRQKRIHAFQETPGFGVLILSPLAVGFGVNIQSANHVIHYTRCWNPAKEDQATDRAYRIGQKRDVHVYCPVVIAPDFKTFDMKLDELLQHKRSLATDMLNGGADLLAKDFDISEVVPRTPRDLRPRRLSFADVCGMEPRYFEAYIAVLWSRKGFTVVSLTPASGDGGVDVLAIKSAQGDLVQCKTSQRDALLGWDAIKDVVTGEAAYRRNHPAVTWRKVCVTTRHFNSGAQRQAELNGVELVDRDVLERLHNDHAVTLEDIEEVLYSANVSS